MLCEINWLEFENQIAEVAKFSFQTLGLKPLGGPTIKMSKFGHWLDQIIKSIDRITINQAAVDENHANFHVYK